MRTIHRIAILTPLIILTIILGFLLDQKLGGDSPQPKENVETTSLYKTSSVSSSVESLYDPMKDPENEESPFYQAAEKESKLNVLKAKAIAEAFTFNGVPKEYEEFCPINGGFCFSYPPSWGKPSWSLYKECIGRDDLIGFTGKFATKEDNYFFGASAFTYANQECQTNGRGIGQLDGLPQMSPETADALIKTNFGESVALWYGDEVGWQTHDYDMIFAAPTSHPLVKRIAFIGPESSSPTLTKEEIEEFLNVIYSYKTMPIQK